MEALHGPLMQFGAVAMPLLDTPDAPGLLKLRLMVFASGWVRAGRFGGWRLRRRRAMPTRGWRSCKRRSTC
jgi:hypothetical protein